MRFTLALFALFAASPAFADARFESWALTCAAAKQGQHCHVTTEAAASGAKMVRLIVSREAKQDSPAHLKLNVLGSEKPILRPRLAIVVDGGPPLRLASGADLAIGPGAGAGDFDLQLSDSAARRMLPFLRRGKVLQATITGDDDAKVIAELPLPGFGPAVAEIDRAQGRPGKPDALAAIVGGATPAALQGLLRDVKRDDVPATLKRIVTDRDCPVWDQTEPDTSFLADESFAADLGDGRTLWAIVCASGSYNVDFALFVEDPSKAANRFDGLVFASFVESLGWTGVDTLANAVYDPEKKELTAFDKGRAQGDCGTVGVWEWVGAAFRMVEYRAKEECDGVGKPEKFPIVFRGER